MATYGDILTEVQLIVPDPSKEDLIRSKINQIIRLISCAGRFWRDVEEVTVGSAEGVSATANIQSIPLTTFVRTLVYVQYPASETKIKCLSLEDLVGRENCSHLTDVAYLSANALHIRNSEKVSSFNLAYYTSPAFFATDTSEDGNSNWVTEYVPGLVVDMTAAYILNLIGDNEDAARISDMAAMFKGTYIRDFVTSHIR